MPRPSAAWLAVTLVVLVLSGCAGLPSQQAIAPRSVAEMYAEFSHVEHDRTLAGAQRTQALREVYANNFTPLRDAVRRAELGDTDMRLVFRVAHGMLFYSRDPAYLGDLRTALRELERRGIATPQDHAKVFRALIKLRKFEQARSLLAAHPTLEVERVPEIVEQVATDNTAPTVLKVDPNRDVLRHRAANLAPTAHIVAVGHPLCHFSQNAVTAIEADPLLRRVFADHATWITPQDGRLHIDVMQQWNLAHPATSMAITYRTSEWPLIDSWGTPTFYFIDHGKLEAKVTGWPDEGNGEALISAMKKTGLLP